MSSTLTRVVNSVIWMVCGALVILIRLLILRTSSVLIWEALGLGMIAYGGVRLVWVIARPVPTEQAIT